MMSVSRRVLALVLAGTAGTVGLALVAGCVAKDEVSGVSAAGPAPAFITKPAVTTEGDRVRIAFSVGRETDVAVSVLDAQGRVVRHLAAGMLGKNAPAPLVAGKLEQSLLWDRTDDDGKAVPAGRYTVRVGLGLTAGATKAFGRDSGRIGRIFGLAAGPGGSLCTLSEGDYGFCRVQLFDADGRYVRTLVPRSAALPVERVKPLGELVLADGQRIPRELLPEFGSPTNQGPVVTAGGDLIFVNGPGPGHPEGHRFRSSERGQSPERRLLRLAADGGAPAAGYLGPVLGPGFEKGDLFLALGADGGTVYVSGARHAVFKVKWDQAEKPVAVVGTPDAAGDGEKLRDPRGIALDAAGNLYVADRGNHRVVSFSPDGKLRGQIAVEWPQQVAVEPKTGALYVAAGFKGLRLLKYAGIGETKPAVEMELGSDFAALCLSARGAEPILHVANLRRNRAAGPAVLWLADAGGTFRNVAMISGGAAPARHLLFGADRRNEAVYAMTATGYGYVRLDGRTGAETPAEILLHPKANGVSEITVAADGTVATHVQGELGRTDGSLRPLPFASTGSFIARLEGDDCPRSNFDRGSCIAPNGDIYWIHERGGYAKPMLVGMLAPDGTLKKDVHITFDTGSPASIRVDRRGCVYVIDHLKPVGELYPAALAGVATNARWDRFVYNYGSLLKFKPEGGAVRLASDRAPGAPAAGAFTTAEGRGRFVAEGLEWSYFGASMIQPALARSEKSPYCCQCWAARFDLDGFDRVFLPDQLRCAVQVLDSNGNPLVRFGGYGNADDAGVALADPRSVMVTDEAAYIGDLANGRVMRVALDYRAKAQCPVEISGPAALPVVKAAPGPYQAADPEKVRLAAVWARWGAPSGEADLAVLKAALTDESEKVRVVAGYGLLRAGDPAGQAEVYLGAQSKDPDVYKLAETAVIKEAVRWDPNDPRAGKLDPALPIVPRFPMGTAEVRALAPLLEAEAWHLNRAVIGMLGLSGRPEAVPSILAKLRSPTIRDRNLNRVLGALGLLRCRQAVPDMLKYLARGRAENWGTEEYNGDRAEQFAATALGRVADPESVSPVIALLDSAKTNTPAEALRALSMMFEPNLPDDCRLVPKDGALQRVLVDRLSAPKELRAAWEEFWKSAQDRYEWSEGGRLRDKNDRKSDK